MWCPPAGQTGFSALGDVLAGETNPSGKTSDTFLKDLTQSVSYNNFGKFEYTNMEDKAAKYKGFTGDEVTAIPGFVNYSEGIYVGYKFYETAADRRRYRLRFHGRVPVRLRPELHHLRAEAQRCERTRMARSPLT